MPPVGTAITTWSITLYWIAVLHFLQTCLGGYRFGKNTRISYRMDENELMIAVPRAAIVLKQEWFELAFSMGRSYGKE